MYRLLPLPALHRHAPFPPEVNHVFQGVWIAHGIVFTVEEQRWCRDWAVVENLDTAVIQVCCVGFEEPEVKQGHVLNKALETWHQSPAKT